MTYRLTRSWTDPHMQKLAEWTREMMEAAGATAASIGCSREAVVAQAALESGWGASAIGHNLFGIKADASWAGARRSARTREVIGGESVMIDAEFRDYPSYRESIADHFAFLRDNGRYAAAGVFNAGSDQAYFEALQRAGYATDPNYAHALMNMLASVKMFTAFMVADAVTTAYVETPTGNVVRADMSESRIVKASDAATRLTTVATASGAVATPLAAVAGMDWKLMMALGAVVLAGALGFAVWKLVQIKAARLDMHDRGIA